MHVIHSFFTVYKCFPSLELDKMLSLHAWLILLSGCTSKVQYLRNLSLFETKIGKAAVYTCTYWNNLFRFCATTIDMLQVPFIYSGQGVWNDECFGLETLLEDRLTSFLPLYPIYFVAIVSRSSTLLNLWPGFSNTDLSLFYIWWT